MTQTKLKQHIITNREEESEEWKRLSEDSIKGDMSKEQIKRMMYLRKKLILNEVK